MSLPLSPVTRDDSARPVELEFTADVRADEASLVSADAAAFCAALEREFGARRRELLERRARVQERLDSGWTPDFPAETAELRSADSNGAPPVLAQPLPAGAEVTVLERRDDWTRVALADGTRGWLRDSAMDTVRLRPR